MANHNKPIQAKQIPAETAQSLYPEVFNATMSGRTKENVWNIKVVAIVGLYALKLKHLKK